MNKEKVMFAFILLIAAELLTMWPSINGWAQIYDFDSGNDHYKVCADPKKNSDVSVQKIKCVNSKINVNGIDITEVPQDGLNQLVKIERCEVCFTTVLSQNELDDLIRELIADDYPSSIKGLSVFIAGNLNEEAHTFISERIIHVCQ
jgi:hypothetical protein